MSRRDVTARLRRPSASVSLLFVVPAILVYGAISLIPNLTGLGYSFTRWDGFTSPDFIGLGNFTRIFQDPEGKGAVVHTLVIAATYVVCVNAIGLGLALGLNRALKSRNLLRALFFAPAAVSPLAVAYIWKYVLQPDGPLNNGLDAAGLGSMSQPWLGHGNTALWAVVAVMLWQFCGYHMVIYLAGLQSIDDALYEAAAIDGAGTWRRFFDITRPQLLPAFTISIALSLIWGLNVFDQVFALTAGGPGTSTETLATQIYRQAFVNGSFGYSAALALLLAIAVALLSFFQIRSMRGQAG